MAVETRVSAFRTAQRRFDAAADVIGLSDDTRRGLREVKRELTVHFPVRMDDGSVHVFTGWRVQHNISRGPAKGGIRYHPDVNLELVKALAMLMTWIMDTISMHAGHSVTASVTGKPVDVGGSEGRVDAPGRGATYLTLEALKYMHFEDQTPTVAVQGYGPGGRSAARLLSEAGLTVVAIGDSKGAVHNPKGLDLAALEEHRQVRGSVAGFKKAAAIEDQVNGQNASRIRARLITEGANAAISPEADPILHERGVFVVPDIIANAGGVIVSYFEWVQDLQAFFWQEEEINTKLHHVITRAFYEIL